MLVIDVRQGELFLKKGDRVTDIHIILKGSVTMNIEGSERTLETGSVIGILAATTGKYLCDYYAKEDCVLATYAYSKPEDLKRIFVQQPQYSYAFLHASIVQCSFFVEQHENYHKAARELYLFLTKTYSEYQEYCNYFEAPKKHLANSTALNFVILPNQIHKWELEWNRSMALQPKGEMKAFFEGRNELCIGEILRASEMMAKMLENLIFMNHYIESAAKFLIAPERKDLVESLFEVMKLALERGADVSQIQATIEKIRVFVNSNLFFDKTEVRRRFREIANFDVEAFLEEVKLRQAEETDVVEDSEETPLFDEGMEFAEDEPSIDDVEELIVDEELAERELMTLDPQIDYFQFILNYAEYDDMEEQVVMDLISEFRKTLQVQSLEDHARDIRRRLSEVYYTVYRKAFFKSLEDKEVSPILELFFRFGFMDAKVLTEKQVNDLFVLNEYMRKNKVPGIYTMYDWLLAIYREEKLPSKNEFDLDYPAYVAELKKNGQIKAAEAAEYLKDPKKKVEYEINNMFRSANRGTAGKGLMFCPILNEEDLIRDVDSLAVSGEQFTEIIDQIRSVDYSCFYREVSYSDPVKEAIFTRIQKEVLPDIILLPNAGSRAMMWQEIEGVHRDTPARFLFPIFTIGDLETLMLETVGRYRWEICRRVQGSRWNDIREKSLTAEYYDYISTYKKNKDISQQMKDKIKQSLVKARNNYRELFAADYVVWMKFEVKGNYRLNKLVRKMFVSYCPFVREIRKSLMQNPMFEELLTRYENLAEKDRVKFNNFLIKMEEEGGTMTDELKEYQEFLNK